MLLNDYLPPFIANTKEFKELFKVLQPKIDELYEKGDNILKDLFVLGSSEEATKHYEKIVGIVPKLSDSLTKRQLDILTIYNEVPPFTEERLQEILAAMIGEDNFKLTVNVVNYKLKLTIRRNKVNFVTEINDMLERIVPVNMVIDYKVDYNIWLDLTKFNWANLKSATWREAREDERFNGFSELE